MLLVFLIRCERQQLSPRDHSAACSTSLFNNAQSVNAFPPHFTADLQSDILRNLISLHYKTSVFYSRRHAERKHTHIDNRSTATGVRFQGMDQ